MRNALPNTGAARITAAIAAAREHHGVTLAPFMTAGYPARPGFVELLQRVASEADLIELGVPFSDPVADGVTIQRSSLAALDGGASIAWILDVLSEAHLDVPVVLMSYLNPLLAYGLVQIVRDAAAANVCGFIVPDMPMEESGPLREAAGASGMCIVQIISPVTPAARIQKLCAAAEGFVYATTMRGITGGRDGIDDSVAPFLGEIRRHTRLPILAGFGIRTARDVSQLQPHCDGVIMGSALIEAIDRGEDAGVFLRTLRANSNATMKGVQP